jgi:hypothetical protein
MTSSRGRSMCTGVCQHCSPYRRAGGSAWRRSARRCGASIAATPHAPTCAYVATHAAAAAPPQPPTTCDATDRLARAPPPPLRSSASHHRRVVAAREQPPGRGEHSRPGPESGAVIDYRLAPARVAPPCHPPQPLRLRGAVARPQPLTPAVPSLPQQLAVPPLQRLPRPERSHHAAAAAKAARAPPSQAAAYSA